MRLRGALQPSEHGHFLNRMGWTSSARFGFLFLLLMPSNVGAWDWTRNEWGEVNREIVETCFSQTPMGTMQPDCIGQAAGSCEYTSPRHGTTFDIMQCRMAEAVVWNEIVEDQFAEQRKALDALDENSATDGWISGANALTNAHKAWADFREAQCHLVYVVNQGGSIKNVRAPICILSMTAGRAFQMRELFREPQ